MTKIDGRRHGKPRHGCQRVVVMVAVDDVGRFTEAVEAADHGHRCRPQFLRHRA